MSSVSQSEDAAIADFLASSSKHHTSAPPPYLDCAICQTTLHDPVVCASGAHTFCRRCLADWVASNAQARAPDGPTCPIDRAPLPAQVQSAPRVVNSMLDELEVACSLGCGWTGKEGERAGHLKTTCKEAEEARNAFRKAFAEALEKVEATGENTASPPEPSQTEAFLGALCDYCRKNIHGRRYKCCSCREFDICGECWDANVRDVLHSATHSFVLVKDIHHYKEGRADKPQMHTGIVCDACTVGPIAGVRFKCTECDIDYCEPCFLSNSAAMLITRADGLYAHAPSHPYLRLAEPLTSGSAARPAPVGIPLSDDTDTPAVAPPPPPAPAPPLPVPRYDFADAFAELTMVSGVSSSAAVHRGIRCDGCDVVPVIGTRWKCWDCLVQYDLCNGCHSRWVSGPVPGFHLQYHQMTPLEQSEH